MLIVAKIGVIDSLFRRKPIAVKRHVLPPGIFNSRDSRAVFPEIQLWCTETASQRLDSSLRNNQALAIYRWKGMGDQAIHHCSNGARGTCTATAANGQIEYPIGEVSKMGMYNPVQASCLPLRESFEGAEGPCMVG